MNGFMALSKERRRGIFEEASARLKLPSASIEKDYWVFLALDGLFSEPSLYPRLTFKGGTSLSKVWKIINRFSEDIDVVIERSSLGYCDDRDPENASTTSAQKKLSRELVESCAECIRKEILPVLERYLSSTSCQVIADPADKDGQTLLVRYESILGPKPSAYITPSVRIELGARSGNEPVETAEIRPLVDEALPGMSWAKTAGVRALDPRRTFLEKAFLIHEECHKPVDKARKTRLSRHLYDVFQLIQRGYAEKAVRDTELFTRVLKNRRTVFRYSWIDYEGLCISSLDICPRDDCMEQWRTDYRSLCEEMIYGTPPDFNQLVSGIRAFANRFMSQGD